MVTTVVWVKPLPVIVISVPPSELPTDGFTVVKTKGTVTVEAAFLKNPLSFRWIFGT